MHLEASYGGFRLLLDSSNEAVKVDAQGRTIRILREENARRGILPLPWNCSFSERRSFEQMVIRRS